MQTMRDKVFYGTIWAVLERCSIQAVGFIVTLVLARLLTPDDYGTVALLSIFLSIASVLIDGGFGQALIQKKNVTLVDYNSVFYLSLLVSFCIYWGLFFLSPVISCFYRRPELIAILRVLAVILLFNSINSIQNAELNRKMLFKLSFRISLIQSAVSAVVGVVLALMKFGAWALVWGQVAGGISGVISRWFIIAWRPSLVFSWKSLRELWGFGWKMTLSSLIDCAYTNLYGLLIGRLYSGADLAYVNKGRHIPELGMTAINGAIGRVAFPALSSLQENADSVRNAMRKIIRGSTFFVFPLLLIIALVADNLVLLLFGEQWKECTPYVRLACYSFALWPFHTVNLQSIAAIGRSDTFLLIEIVKKAVGVTLVLLTFNKGVFPLMFSLMVIVDSLALIINSFPSRRYFKYGIESQLKDVGINFVSCIPLVAVCLGVGCIPHSNSFFALALLIVGQCGLGLIAYILTAVILKSPMVNMLTPLLTRSQRQNQ